jgi:mRNA interferase RelE/StbE
MTSTTPPTSADANRQRLPATSKKDLVGVGNKFRRKNKPISLEINLYSGYSIARMRYEIILSPEARQDLKLLDANQRSQIRDLIELHLRHAPTKVSKSRIKRLRGLSRPQYRLRIDEVRVFYDVTETRVEILAIIPKSKVSQWLEEVGEKT